jgi:hypothetical protein
MDLRKAIAANLRQAMEASHDPELQTATSLGRAAEVGRRTVDRLLSPETYEEHGPELASLAALAEKLGKEPWELLVSRTPMLRGNIRTDREVQKSTKYRVAKRRQSA